MRFTLIAIGSLNEVESQMHIACALGYLSEDDFGAAHGQIKEIGNLLGGLRNYLTK